MSGHPWRIVAVQTALSLAVIVVVYLTLLKPDGGEPLVDVEAPGPGADRQGLAERPQGERAARPRGRRAQRPAGSETSLAGGSLVGVPAVDPERTDTPSFDQYSGTLDQLRARLDAP